MKNKLVVCGDSFHSIASNYKNQDNWIVNVEGTHYSELLAKRLDYDLINLALPGGSLGAVGLQILEAIELSAEIIIIGPANGMGTRTEFLLKEEITWENNLGDFFYQGRKHPYDNLNKSKTEVLGSKSIMDVPYEEYRNQLIKYFSVKIRKKYDELSFFYAFRKLVDSKIKFLVFSKAHPWFDHYEESFINHLLKYCQSDNIIFRNDFNPHTLVDFKTQVPYHTKIEDQLIIAEYLESRIRNQFNV